jgi:hypothetical protein
LHIRVSQYIFFFFPYLKTGACTRWVWESVLYLHPTPHTLLGQNY